MLCRTILQLARTAVARMLLRDHDEGFLSLSERDRGAMAPRAGMFGAHVEALATAWRHAERADPDGPLPVLGAACGGTENLLLLVLAAAPSLERAVARTYRTLDRDGLSCGLLLDLVGEDEEGRLTLAHALAVDAPLRRHGLVVTPNPTVLAGDPVTVPASVIAALRGEPIVAPPAIDRAVSALDRDAAGRDLAAVGVSTLRAGELRLIDGDGANAMALAERLAATSGCPLWLVGMSARPEAPEHVGAWVPLVRDAHLANSLVVIDLADGDPAVAAALASAARALDWPCLALGSLSPAVTSRNQREGS